MVRELVTRNSIGKGREEGGHVGHCKNAWWSELKGRVSSTVVGRSGASGYMLQPWAFIRKGVQDAGVAGEGGRGKEIVMYVLWGGMLAESKDGKVTYEGGSRKCMVVKEGMGVEELMKMVREMTGTDMSEKKLWYSLKCDKEMFVAVEGDSDVNVIFEGNNKHDYLYVAGNGSPVRQAQESATQLARTGRKCNYGVEVGEEGGNEETTKEDDAGDEQAAEKRCDDVSKRKGSVDGNYNGVGERIEQKLADTYKKMGYIAAVEYYSFMLYEYSVELTNNCKLVVKLGQ
ncbi:hypothetical protein Cgig2_016510 [Carnegiea gigantea]|uniref:PB1 domain-containing protein n=1 Tax=Carnegiea gigantea TaxID=171969 RepID=A0A9Q1GH90_9CARY|nr:hypothetical protein Cgig2_016510 [Carnegiea gigantea]